MHTLAGSNLFFSYVASISLVPMTNHPSTPIPPVILTSLVTPAYLLAIVAAQTGTRLLEQLGVASEEIFRGDRLPILHFPVDGASPVDNPQT